VGREIILDSQIGKSKQATARSNARKRDLHLNVVVVYPFNINYYTGLLKMNSWTHYSRPRLVIYSIATSNYFEYAIAAIIGLNIFTMALEYHNMPKVGVRFLD